MKTAVLVNLGARLAAKYSQDVVDRIEKLENIEVVDVISIKGPSYIQKCLEKLGRIKDLECVILASGDGTINATINALRDRDVIYGFLPLGTSNTFARSLGLPKNYKKAIKVIESSQIQKASLGEVNGYLFANIAGIGVPETVAKKITNRHKKILGNAAYIISGFWHMLRHRAPYCDILADSRQFGFYTHHLLIANGKYHGTLPLSPDVSVFNDQISIIALGTKKNRFNYFISGVLFGLGLHLKSQRVKYIYCKKAVIKTEPVRFIEVDGEVIGRTPANISIKQKAIRVFAPASD